MLPWQLAIFYLCLLYFKQWKIFVITYNNPAWKWWNLCVLCCEPCFHSGPVFVSLAGSGRSLLVLHAWAGLLLVSAALCVCGRQEKSKISHNTVPQGSSYLSECLMMTSCYAEFLFQNQCPFRAAQLFTSLAAHLPDIKIKLNIQSMY